LGSFSRNLRKEISKGFKIYFYDLGVRNSIVQQYQDINIRLDKGGIWENFLICERLKWLHNHQFNPNRYFWRTHDQQEIDYIEEFNGQLTAYELKWKIKRKSVPKAFVDSYKNTSLKYVDRETFEGFISTQLT